MAKKSTTPRQARHPEKKIGPFAGGIGVAIWLNTVDTDDGKKQFRSVTIAPRRYQDRETGEWKDAGNFNPSDLPALIFALQKAQEYVFTTPAVGREETSHFGDRPRVAPQTMEHRVGRQVLHFVVHIGVQELSRTVAQDAVAVPAVESGCDLLLPFRPSQGSGSDGRSVGSGRHRRSTPAAQRL
mgnify:CR=1 FL=1